LVGIFSKFVVDMTSSVTNINMVTCLLCFSYFYSQPTRQLQTSQLLLRPTTNTW